MDHHTPVLIATIAIGLSLAFVLGMVARRLRLPDPHRLSRGGRAHRALHHRLCRGRRGRHRARRAGRGAAHVRHRHPLLHPGPAGGAGPVALPGGHRAGHPRDPRRASASGSCSGWGLVGGLVLGLSISVASTVVLLRALIERGELDSIQGRVAVGWRHRRGHLHRSCSWCSCRASRPILTGEGGVAPLGTPGPRRGARPRGGLRGHHAHRRDTARAAHPRPASRGSARGSCSCSRS